jgi:type II secretory pathway pseudopilin PulG
MKYEVQDHASPHKKIFSFFSLHRNSDRAFTVVELLVSVGIFVFLTVLLVVKYGSFNQSVLLTNLAYDVAVTIRTAQAYGLSVKKVGAGDAASNFQYAYGVHFDTTPGKDATITLFAFTPVQTANHTYNKADGTIEEDITQYTLKRGARITGLCVNSTNCNPAPFIDHKLDIIFRRPNPNGDICFIDDIDDFICGFQYAEITIAGTDGSTRVVAVRENGQIFVVDN